MPTWTEVAQKNGIPFSTPSTSGDLVNAGNVGDISRQGTYQPRNLLPGDTSQLPTTYSVPGEGTKQVPYTTVDVPAETIPGNRLGAAANSQLPGVSNAGSLPEGRFGSVPTNTTGTLDGISGYGLKGSQEIKGLPVLGGNLASGAAAESSLAQGVLGPRLGAAAEAISPALRSLGNLAKRLSPLGNLLDIADFLKGEGTADEAGQLAKAQAAEASKKQMAKNQAGRKGNKVSGIPKPDGSKPVKPTPGALYRITYTVTYDGGTPVTQGDVQVAPFSIETRDSPYGPNLVMVSQGQVKYIITPSQDGKNSAAITNAVRIDGGTDPLPTRPAPQLNPDGTAIPDSLAVPQKNSDPSPNPLNQPAAQQMPASARSPSASPGITPGQTPADAPAPAPAPENPFLPARSPVPTAAPAPAPAPTQNPSPGSSPSASPTTSPNVQAQPLNPLSPQTVTSTEPKAPGFAETPGVRKAPETTATKTPETPNIDPEEANRCCPDTNAKLDDMQDKNKPVEIVVKVFRSCKISGGTTSAASSSASTPASTAPSSGTTTTTTGSGGTTTTSTTSSGTVSNPVISDGTNKATTNPTTGSGATEAPETPETIQEGNAIFETKTIKVAGQEAANYRLLYERIAKLEAQHCDGLADGAGQAIASVPEWWQLRPEAQRPQLVIIFAEVKSTGKLGDSRWSLTIPHYNKPKGFKPRIPAYEKGNFQGVLTLTDNSKLIVNAKTASECKRVLNSLKLLVPANYRTVNGKGIKPKVGELPDAGFKVCRVTPARADFYKTGARNLVPNWSIDLKGKS